MRTALTRSGLSQGLVTAIAIGLVIMAITYLQQTWGSVGASQAVVPASGNSAAQPRPGYPAPDFQVTMLDGTTTRLSDLRGQPVWLSFWASWCPPCRVENPDVDAIYRQMKDRGLVMIAVDMGESPAEIKSYLELTGYTFPVGLDTSYAITNLYQINGIPTHFFIDRAGIIADMRVGTIDREATLARIEKLLTP